MLCGTLGGCATKRSVEDAAPADELAAVSWLAGTWTSPSAEESWTAPDGASMSGVNRAGEHVELLRIDARDGRLIYTAAPPGQAVTAFTTDPNPTAPLVFANPGHDFPKRITYAREGADRFTARISGDAGDREASWTFARTGEAPIPARAHGTVTLDVAAHTLAVEIPGSYCGQLVCAVLPTPTGPALHVAIIDSDLDCSEPAQGSCTLPSADRLPRLGEALLSAPTWTGPIPHLYRVR